MGEESVTSSSVTSKPMPPAPTRGLSRHDTVFLANAWSRQA
ncbi:Uncharacterised protein [Mycobacterium tuberculosis]|uniref:Uncharacterized protein n=1 Tax=Mycobacterium tuberculosis TaxID=1773 RepID=A0A0U0RW26_MYCTX|nr:Uncharacterised protein [Mycobacterium tuberculosis]